MVGKSTHVRDWVGVVIVIALASGLYFGLHFSFENIFFWVFCFVLVYWDLDSRISIGLALVALVAVAILNAMGNSGVSFVSGWDERVAVWVYYFLVIGVVKQIVEMGTSRVKSRKSGGDRVNSRKSINSRVFHVTEHVRSARPMDVRRRPIRSVDGIRKSL